MSNRLKRIRQSLEAELSSNPIFSYPLIIWRSGSLLLHLLLKVDIVSQHNEQFMLNCEDPVSWQTNAMLGLYQKVNSNCVKVNNWLLSNE